MLSNDQNNLAAEGTVPVQQFVPIEEKKMPVYGKSETMLSAAVFILSFLFVRYTLFNTTGIITSLVYIGIITAAIVYIKKKEYVFSALNKVLAALLYVFSLVFTITDNGFIKFLNCIFLFGAGAYLVYSVCAGKESIDRYLPYAVKSSVLRYPFSKFGVQLRISSDCVKDSRTSNNIKMIIGGLILAVPVTVVVAALLMSADDGMNRMLGNIFDEIFTEDLWTWLVQAFIAIPCSLYLFGMFYSNANRDDLNVLTDEECEYRLKAKRTVGNLIFYSSVTPVLILYVMFFISQASYFLSAFAGRLPEEFSYAEYARKGFFELCWIVVINLGIMIIMNLHAKNSGEEKTAALKVINVIFCIFTLILIATAMSKMIMYINAYGLTELRVYTTWFMVLCAYIFLLILAKQFKGNMHMSKWISVGFTFLFAILCFSRPESLIVKYNHDSGKVTAENFTESGILSMSDDGILAAVDEGLMTEKEGREHSEMNHSRHMTDHLNISTLVLENR